MRIVWRVVEVDSGGVWCVRVCVAVLVLKGHGSESEKFCWALYAGGGLRAGGWLLCCWYGVRGMFGWCVYW